MDARKGEKQTIKEVAKEVAITGTATTLAGSLLGLMASAPAQVLKIPFKKLRGKSLTLPLAAAGGVGLGAFGVGTRLSEGRKVINPGPEKTYGYIPELKHFRKDIKNPKSTTYKEWVRNDYND